MIKESHITDAKTIFLFASFAGNIMDSHIATLADDDALADILQELGSTDLGSKQIPLSHSKPQPFTKTKMHKQSNAKTPERFSPKIRDCVKRQVDLTNCEWTNEDESFFSQLGVNTEIPLASRNTNTEKGLDLCRRGMNTVVEPKVVKEENYFGSGVVEGSGMKEGSEVVDEMSYDIEHFSTPVSSEAPKLEIEEFMTQELMESDMEIETEHW